MLKKVLIANRGEIAVRAIRTCRELGIKTVSIFPECDRDSMHSSYADASILIDEKQGSKAYLSINDIIEAAKDVNADAIFPGYGFLSENSDFAKACQDNKITFIGPSAQSISDMGNKYRAREMMQNASVPVIPGRKVDTPDQAAKAASEIGFPLIVKASGGGGGKGLRIIASSADLKQKFHEAQMEAKTFFHNDEMYMEKYIADGKHIEVQILGDKLGNVVHLYDRECSIQRRHQKLLEEAPSPSLDSAVRTAICETAAKAARSIGYYGAGTFEFIFSKEKKFYFMEMNTRIQVEHPVTEMITGVDIVRLMILAASGEKLDYKQQDISIRGHSMECRINAENPAENFMPSPGVIAHYTMPSGPGVRVDSHLYPDYNVPHEFDSLLAKLIVHAETRQLCIARMKRALNDMMIAGVHTTIPLHQQIIADPIFMSGAYTTSFLERKLGHRIPGVFHEQDYLNMAHGCFEEEK
jgi:acetyl-CoA carboxylase biotin carboxylase subunit